MSAVLKPAENVPTISGDAEIMALCDQAIINLQEARTIGDVQHLAGVAAALATYARKHKAAVEAQNAAQTVVFLAEARIGVELKKGQASGDVAKVGNPDFAIARSSDNSPATLPELGIPRQRASEMKKLAELGDDHIKEAAQAATEAGERLTREAVLNHRAQGTGENEWYTPPQYIAVAREFLGGIDLDPASSPLANETVRASHIFTIDDDGLAQEWRGKVWMNPPYAQPAIAHFSEKLVAEVEAGRVTEAIALTHNYTDTGWFHWMAASASAICFTRGRIGFLSPEGKKASPTQGQAFFYFGPRVAQFAESFGTFGFVVVRHGV